MYLQTLVIREKDPVFMTAFRPLATVIVAVMGLLILGEELYLGSIVGSVLIVLGLYAILWQKIMRKRRKSWSSWSVISIHELRSTHKNDIYMTQRTNGSNHCVIFNRYISSI
ncbi:hypothetical protein Pint_36478 [Pistacia integerrima]|uniref:Uncharacterized protein n=1 Tax=Pistacia integerrima TaxID=434235 RepID=A0ACC0Y4E9_9ROSI|nr:hypothetical protein Pint_36478 [Pistacia integerrima]